MREIRTVCLAGSGTIGASWAAFYASKGLAVRMTDASADCLATGRARVKAHLDFLLDRGLMTAAAHAGAAERVSVTELEAGVADADLIHESVSEDYDVKLPLFGRIDAAARPDAIVASSSSGLLVSRLQSVMARPERALIAHPFNPPHLVPLVELVGGAQTAPEVLEAARQFYESLGKTPVVLKKEVPGHIANRLAAALWREAIDLVASGVASVEAVDKALHAGPGVRWAFMGQHMIYHLGGGGGGYRAFIEHIGSSFEDYFKTMATWSEIPGAAREAVIRGVEAEAGGRSLEALGAWRDEKLVQILKARAAEPGV